MKATIPYDVFTTLFIFCCQLQEAIYLYSKILLYINTPQDPAIYSILSSSLWTPWMLHLTCIWFKHQLPFFQPNFQLIYILLHSLTTFNFHVICKITNHSSYIHNQATTLQHWHQRPHPCCKPVLELVLCRRLDIQLIQDGITAFNHMSSIVALPPIPGTWLFMLARFSIISY